MSNKSYIVIPDEFTALPIDLWETVILSVIFGFSQDGESMFHGSLKYLQRKAKCSRNKVVKSLAHLVNLGFVEKADHIINGVKFCEYRCTFTEIPSTHGVLGSTHEVLGGSTHGVPNIIDINIKRNNKDTNTVHAPKFVAPSVYDVESYCIEAGLVAMVAQDFYDYYESNGWKVGRNAMKDWKAAARRWDKAQQERNAERTRRNQPRQTALDVTLQAMRDFNAEHGIQEF